MSSQIPIPANDPIARPPRKEFIAKKQKDPQEGLVSQSWVDWFTALLGIATSAPETVDTIRLTGQAASIAATDMTDGTLPAGPYRVTWYLRVTQQATISSDLEVTIGWTDDGATQQFSGATIVNGNLTSHQSYTLLVESDDLSPITYTVSYNSAGATAQEYKLTLCLEQLPT